MLQLSATRPPQQGADGTPEEPAGQGLGQKQPLRQEAGLKASSLPLAPKAAPSTLAGPIRILGPNRTHMTQDVPYEQITAALGSLLFLWADIERRARKDLAKANGGEVPKSVRGINAALKAWMKLQCEVAPSQISLRPELARSIVVQLKPHLDVRNGLCHGLLGATAGYHGQQAYLSWEMNGQTSLITWDELQATFSWLSRVRRAMDMIASEELNKTAGRLRDNAENRVWWREEFLLGVPTEGEA